MLLFDSAVDCSVARFGRRIPYCAFMLIGGVAGLLVLAVPDTPGEGDISPFNFNSLRNPPGHRLLKKVTWQMVLSVWFIAALQNTNQ